MEPTKVVFPVAAGMWDRMLAFLGFEEEEEDVEEEQSVALAAVTAAAPRQAQLGGREDLPRRRTMATVRTARSGWSGEDRGAEYRSGTGRGATVTRLVPGFPGLVVAAPRRFEESQEAADHLKAGKPVLLHLEGVERELAQRLINFLAGSVYALGGEMHRVGAAVLFVPAGIDVTLPLSLRMGERAESR